MVGERGFEPPTPWSRTRVPGANFVITQSFEWCFNRPILAQSCHSWRNVNPRIATLREGNARFILNDCRIARFGWAVAFEKDFTYRLLFRLVPERKHSDRR
jgi:hypothetical protein